MSPMAMHIAAHHDGQRHVLLLDDLGPQVIGRELVDDDEAHPEDQHADQREQHRAEEHAGFEPFDSHHGGPPSCCSLVAAAAGVAAEAAAAGAEPA
jgi:hypothetical protein